MQNDPPTGFRHDGLTPRSHSRRFRTDGEQARSEPLVLVSMSDYWPGKTLRIVGQLPAPITVQLLRLPNDETVPVLRRPDEYTGYVVRAELEDDQVESTMVLYTRETLESGRYYELLSDVEVFSERLRLLRSTVRATTRQEENDNAVLPG